MLEQYRGKRDFKKTAEPSGAAAKPSEGDPSFVVQKHAATRLHYDFRLEADGVLKSWAVPKGPSMNPKDKHLAVMVEDHPLDYAGFEGTIPKGEYGGGEVIVWDRGTYQVKGPEGVAEGIEEGKVHFTLFGQKLKGEFVLTRMHGDDPKNWLMMKVRDGLESEEDVLKQDESVASHRTIEQVREGVPATPSRSEPVGSRKSSTSVYAPMLAYEAGEPFDDENWEFELKLDGVRAIASKQNGRVSLTSRNGNEIGDHMEPIAKAIQELAEKTVVLDGELVFFDAEGKPSFQQLMRRIRPEGGMVKAEPGRVAYCVFDLLRLGTEDLRNKPWRERRARLEQLALSEPLRLVDSYPGAGKVLYEQAVAMGFEGVMAKKIKSVYEPGQRSRSWLKVKSYHSEEYIVGGYTEGRGARKASFGGLLLGQKDASGALTYSGKVGGGFSEADLGRLRPMLERLETKTSPFVGKVVADDKASWVEPKLIVEVKFMTRTEDHLLRFPTFIRLRDDVQEAPKPMPNPMQTPGPNSVVDDVLTQLDRLEDSGEITIGEHTLRLTHLSKALWPGTKDLAPVTKLDLLRYFARISGEMLPFLKDRPISFVRNPEGIEKQGFFQKHPLPGTPEFVQCVKIWSEHSSEALDWLVCNDLETLLWLAQVGTVEIHPWYSRIRGDGLPTKFETHDGLEESALEYPDFVVLDLDPNIKESAKSRGAHRVFDPEAWAKTVSVALALRELLKGIHLEAWVKSSGKTGLHLYVPIERKFHYGEVKAIAQSLGEALEKERPSDVTMVWTVKKRPNAVFIDHNQNVRGKTLACPFSPRASTGAPVSFPLTWQEIESFDPTKVTVHNAPELVGRQGNPWRDILDHPQTLKL